MMYPDFRFCPYAQRTVHCLNAKGVDYEVINCALMTKPEWLWELNPIGKVPVLMHKVSLSILTTKINFRQNNFHRATQSMSP